MCFSASASFTAAGILVVIGMVSTAKAKERYRLLAFAPFLFAVQQAIEGLLWLSFVHTKMMTYQSYFVYGFLLCAFVLWPILVPVSLYRIEIIRRKKILLSLCCMSGIFTAFSLFSYLYTYGATAMVINHHIVYMIHYPHILWSFGTLLYILSTVLPFFISSIRLGWLLGTCLLISYSATYFFYQQALISVWCFFAALLSILILIIIP